MSRYLPLLERAISHDELDYKARFDVYARAREELLRHLQSTDFRVSKEVFEEELGDFELAISQIEERFSADPPISIEYVAGAVSVQQEAAGIDATGVKSLTRGGRWFVLNAGASWLVNICKAALQVLLVPIMARLLDPTAYGIYSLAFPTVLFFMTLADGGLGATLSREDESNRVLWSTASWLLLVVCGFAAVIVGLSGVVLASMSGQPSLRGIMLLLAVAPIIMAVSIPADARLVRRGNLLFHSGGDLAAFILGAVVAVALAYAGFGAWALAAQYITNFLVRAIVFNVGARTLPDFVFDLSSLSGHISTGRAVITSGMSELVGKFAENALFSHIYGTGQLGSYSLAEQVARYMCGAVTNPLVGTFYAHALHASDHDVSALYVRLVRITLCILMPITVMAAVLAGTAFPLMLGQKWIDSAPMLRSVVVSYALLGAASFCPQILLRHGMYNRSARVLVVSVVLRIGAVIAGFTGLSAVSVTWLVGAILTAQAAALMLAVPTRIGAAWKDLLSAACPPAVAAGGGGLAASLLLRAVPPELASVAAASALGFSVYTILLFILDGRALRNDISRLQRALLRPRT